MNSLPDLRSRVVGIDSIPAGQLVANPANFRIHPKAQQSALAGSLESLGWIDTVLVNRQTNFVIDGHARVVEALRRGDDTPVPVLYVDLSPEEEAQAMLSLDPIAALAGTDRDQMAALMAQVQSDDARIQEFMAALAEQFVPMLDDGEYAAKHNNRVKPSHSLIVVGFGPFAAPIDVELCDSALAAIKAHFGDDPAAALEGLCEYLSDETLFC